MLQKMGFEGLCAVFAMRCFKEHVAVSLHLVHAIAVTAQCWKLTIHWAHSLVMVCQRRCGSAACVYSCVCGPGLSSALLSGTVVVESVLLLLQCGR